MKFGLHIIYVEKPEKLALLFPLVCSEPGGVQSSQRILNLGVRLERVELWLVQDGIILALAML